MGRITASRRVVRLDLDAGARRRPDALAVEEPLEIRLDGRPYAVTMRTPGDDVELAIGFLLAEGVIERGDDVRRAIHCGGPGTGGEGSTYNVLDIALAPEVARPDLDPARNFAMTSACGVCGSASIDAVRRSSRFDVDADPMAIPAELVASLPERLREAQAAFETTGGLHAAALFEAATGALLVAREDVGRHNAVDKAIGALAQRREPPFAGLVLQVSGRASFELVQKAMMAGIPMLSAVSAPSSLAVDLAREAGITLAGFVRGRTMNLYSRPDRVLDPSGEPEESRRAAGQAT